MKLNSRILLTSAALTALAPFAFAQTEMPEQPLKEVDFDSVVATVNGTEITAGQIALMRERLPQQYQTMEDAALFDALLDQMITQELLSIDLGEEPTLVAAAVANERRSLRAGLKLQEVVNAAVTEEALQAAYDEAYESAEPSREYHAAHILVESEEEAQQIVEQLAEGGEFAQLAQAHSKDTSGPAGGDLGWFAQGVMVAPFEEAVMALEPGDVSEPIQTQFGWHIIRLIESRMTEAPALDEVRAELAQTVQRRAAERYVADLMDAGEVERSSSQEIDASFMSNPAFFGE